MKTGYQARESILFQWRFYLMGIAISPLLVSADLIDDMKPGTWAEIPNTHLEAVKPNPLPRNQSGFAVMVAWSGGAADTKRGRLLVWGGGHGDYSGNELYAFDIATLKWARLTDPSTDVGGEEGTGLYPDGSPRSRHTYDYIEYIPNLDAFCTFGGGAMYPSGSQGSRKTICYEFETKKWQVMGDAITGGIGAVSGYDPVTGHLWLQGSGNNPVLAEWNPVANTWKKHQTYPAGWFPYMYTGAAGRGMFVAIGEGKTLTWNLMNGTAQLTELSTTGDKDILSAKNAGIAYDTDAEVFVAWNGGTNVYVLDVDAKQWAKMPIGSGNSVTPTAATSNGIFGRWQYLPTRKVFVGVNATNQNVFVYKLPENVKSIKPSPEPVPTQGLRVSRRGNRLALREIPDIREWSDILGRPEPFFPTSLHFTR